MALASLEREAKLPKDIIDIIKKYCSKTHPVAQIIKGLIFVRDDSGILDNVIWPEKYICIPVWAYRINYYCY